MSDAVNDRGVYTDSLSQCFVCAAGHLLGSAILSSALVIEQGAYETSPLLCSASPPVPVSDLL